MIHQQRIEKDNAGQGCRLRQLLHGFDSLYVSFFLDTSASKIDWDDLVYRKEMLIRERRKEFSEITLGSETFALLPRGSYPYAYVLKNKAFEVQLAERLQPCCFVKFSSEALWNEGIDALEARLRKWFASINSLQICPEKVSRFDYAFDYHLPDATFEYDWFVSRAKKDAAYRESRSFQTFSFGRGDIVVRIYDKVAEIEQESGKAWFFDLWEENKQVWRIEFQVRGERVGQGGIRTLEDLRNLIWDLLRELAENHTSLRQPSADTNRSRWPLHPLWQDLLNTIAAQPQTGLVRSFDPENGLEWRFQKQKQSIFGALKGLAAVKGLLEGHRGPIPFDELLEELPEVFASEHSETLWSNDVEKRMKAHGYGLW